ncbi:serine hydrolase domain-containing protein [Aquisalimonas asiatica]|uniref:CubicO group peptidase, beta-lactamase class C family n=1 Tax=Aquisalimonas asiatica TaxID=406100 RepID=A0A1H8PKK8_9GAMM|nr:serine hydrolase domain-containing protein [Aquisalimonas asiatica]SEO42321.1 CubicO group peptidase, beta-lactamase class C family [Aquisalimonas asiatica]
MESTDPRTVGLSGERLGRIGRWMREHVERERLAGASLLINRGGETAYFDACGHLDREAQSPVTADSIFRIYSMTKPVTSVAAMMLYEQGAFQLDDPIARFLPEFENMEVLVGGDADNPQCEPAHTLITMRNLLTHTAGLTYHFFMASPVDALYHRHGISFNAPDTELGDMVTRLAGMPLLFHPGTRWNYGVSTDVLGRVVEVISGKPLDRFFHDEIFEPLAMHDTGFGVTEAQRDRLATMYTSSTRMPPPRIGPQPTELPPELTGGLTEFNNPAGGQFHAPVTMFSGGGGLTSTIGDYLRFCLMLRNGGELDGARLLGRKTVEFMQMNHLPGTMEDMGEPRFNSSHMGAGLGFGLGFAVVLDPALAETMGSPGEYFWSGMANTQFWIDPEEDLIVIQMAQLMPSSLLPMRRELRSLVYQAIVD